MKSGLFTIPPEFLTVCQSLALAGEKSLVPSGQLLLSFVLYIVKQDVHFIREPAEYAPLSATLVHLQLLGLPLFGCTLPPEPPEFALGVFGAEVVLDDDELGAELDD